MEPISQADFALALKEFEQKIHTPVIVAVSGGADSLALVYLLKTWCNERGIRLIGVSVDHGLRPESAYECLKVKEWLNTWSVEHFTLTWKGAKPTTEIQEKARNARYHLLNTFCKEYSPCTLMTAHQQDDAIETFMMRLNHGSSLKGLLSIPAVQTTEYGYLIRPCLELSHAQLVATLELINQPWIDDPSNQNNQFERILWRNMLKNTSLIKSRSILSSINKLTRSMNIVDYAIKHALNQTSQFLKEGCFRINPNFLTDFPEELVTEALRRIIWCFSTTDYPPQYKDVSNLYKRLRESKNATLGSCQFVFAKKNLWVSLEKRALPLTCEINGPVSVKWGPYEIILQEGKWTIHAGNQTSKDIPARIKQTLPNANEKISRKKDDELCLKLQRSL